MYEIEPFTLRLHRHSQYRNRLFENVLGLNKYQNIYKNLDTVENTPQSFIESCLKQFNIKTNVNLYSSAQEVPTTGPLICVANRPFGGIEALTLRNWLYNFRNDLRFMANEYLSQIPELAPILFNVSVFNKKTETNENNKSMHKTI